LFDKFFVGRDVTSAQNNGQQLPISRVTLLLDDENSLTAGDDSGIELVADCPHATQTMVNAILAQVKGHKYQMYRAENAGIDPSAELGDGVTVDGMYSVISRLDDDGSGYAGLSAPGEADLEDEYPAVGPVSQGINRKIAQTRSSITKTAEQIRLEVSNEVKGLNARITVEVDKITQEVNDKTAGLSSKIEQTESSLTTQISNTKAGLESEIKQASDSLTAKISATDGRVTSLSASLDGISTRVKNAEGDISTLEQTATGLQSQITGVNGSVSSLEQTVDGIYINVKNGEYKSTIELYKDNFRVSSMDITFSGYVTFTSLSTPGMTTINGGNIDTDTLRVNNLFGRYINLNTNNGDTAGTIEVTGASTASYAVELASNGALRLVSGHGQIFLQAAAGGYIQVGGPYITVGDQFDPVRLVPNQNGIGYLGSSSQRWNTVYAVTGEIQTSDRNQKHDIDYDLSRFDTFFDKLKPISFKFNQNESNRTHLGLCAQDVEEALAESGLSTLDFAGFIKSPRMDEKGKIIEGVFDYALRYTEFIPMLITQVQDLKALVAELKRRISP